MMLQLLIVDDDEAALDALVPEFVGDLARRLAADPRVQQANAAAGFPLPAVGDFNLGVATHGFSSRRLPEYAPPRIVHVRLHLCCDKTGGFRYALRLLKEHFTAVVVSDLRFTDDAAAGRRAGMFLVDDLRRRSPDAFGILHSSLPRPDGFPADRFVAKSPKTGALGSPELLDRIVEGTAAYLRAPRVRDFARELGKRHLVYQSNAFDSALRRLYDYAHLYFGLDAGERPDRLHRRPRPTVLLDGESGTGKTELAGLLHQASERRHYPFVRATCSELTNENLLRSTLFGHVKGAYSGASTDRPGLVQAAGRGVLLLDDLHKLNDPGSVILHSFLDDGEFAHLGQDEHRRQAELAVVCTVEGPKWDDVKAHQTLPESFVHRVEQLVVKIPPLRDRPEDVEIQAQYYVAQHSREIGETMTLSPDAVQWLADYGFPGGNSRKLRDFLQGVVADNNGVTDHLDVEAVEEYAHDTGLGGRNGHARKPAAVVTPAAVMPSPTPPAPAPVAPWPAERDAGGWPARVAEL
ncbi:MAG: sigma-54-dependent transcriptional regulator, partial [Planctomycetia bacterium]